MREIKYKKINDKIIKEEIITNVIENIMIEGKKENLLIEKNNLLLQIKEIDDELEIINQFEIEENKK